jgi:hypothetical protein
MPTKFVKCLKCGRLDKSTKHPRHVGTSTSMRCPDCSGYDGLAAMCRDCCPTGHATREEVITNAKNV